MKKNESLNTEKYRYCNHHHELTDEYEIVNFGTGKFVANKAAVPLLRALNNAGLITRTHHFEGKGNGFISIILDNASIEVRKIHEYSADRTIFNNKYELLINWKK